MHNFGQKPFKESCRVSTSAHSPSTTSLSRPVTAGASPNTKGSWVQLIEATPFDYSALYVTTTGEDATFILFDIGLGGAGSEQVIIPDLLVQFNSGGGDSSLGQRVFALPVFVPAGARITARSQSGVGGGAPRCSVMGLSPSPFKAVGGRVIAIGVDSGNSRGSQVDPGGSAHTKGSWTTLSSSIPSDVIALIVAVGGQGHNVASYGAWRVDIGMGGSNTIVIPDVQFICYSATQNGTIHPPTYPPFPVSLPAGTSIQARAQSGLTTSGQRQIDIALYGVVA